MSAQRRKTKRRYDTRRSRKYDAAQRETAPNDMEFALKAPIKFGAGGKPTQFGAPGVLETPVKFGGNGKKKSLAASPHDDLSEYDENDYEYTPPEFVTPPNDKYSGGVMNALKRRQSFDVCMIFLVSIVCFSMVGFTVYSRYSDFSREMEAERARLDYEGSKPEPPAPLDAPQPSTTPEPAPLEPAVTAPAPLESPVIPNRTDLPAVTDVAEEKEISAEFIALREQYANDDIVGYIKIDGTTIDYPVVQSRDNIDYLTLDTYGKKSSSGSIFLDCENDVSRDDRNVIVYGHNMNTRKMFHDLRDYRDEDFFESHRIIKFDTLYDRCEYEVFSFYKSEDTFNYIQVFFDGDEEFAALISDMKARSMYDTGVGVSSDDRILTLSTCSNAEEDTRYVVNAKLVNRNSTAYPLP
jgi:sortase B